MVRAYNAVKCEPSLFLRMNVVLTACVLAFLKDCEDSGNNVADINLVALDAGVSLSADSIKSSASSLVVLLDPMALLSLAILSPLFAAIAASLV